MTLDDVEADAIFHRYLEAFEAAWVPYADVVPCLAQLARNSHQWRWESAAGEAAANRHLPTLFGDSRLRRRGRIQTAPGHLSRGLPPRCLYVGDNWETDIVPARAVGMREVWLNRGGRIVPGREPAIGGPAELVGIVSGGYRHEPLFSRGGC